MKMITSFVLFAQKSDSLQSQVALVKRSESPNVNSNISLLVITEVL